jgi:Spy/CpxP family protein refolding chaperone
MRRIHVAVLAAAFLAFTAAPAFAQRGPGGGGRMGGGDSAIRLLENKSVQEELKITDDEKAKVEKIRDAHKDELDKAGRDFQKRAEVMKTINEELTKALPDILKEDQLKRFKQVEVQVAGFRAFDKEDVQKALSLTDKQTKEYASAKDDLAKDTKDLFPAPGGGGRPDPAKMQEAMKKVQELTKEATDKFTATFSDDQKKAYKDLTGDKFDYKPEMGGGRGGAGGRPGGRRPPPPTTDK